VLGADGTIYVTNEDQTIFAVNHNGTQQWVAGGGPYADKGMGSIAAAIDQTYLYTPWRELLRAVRLMCETFSWPTGYGFQRGGSVAKLGERADRLYRCRKTDCGGLDGTNPMAISVMNPPLTTDMITKNGGHVPVGDFWLDSAMAVGDESTLYFCAVDSRLIALTADGQFLWESKRRTIP
jgi:outer membrane protein assembly factor BamB